MGGSGSLNDPDGSRPACQLYLGAGALAFSDNPALNLENLHRRDLHRQAAVPRIAGGKTQAAIAEPSKGGRCKARLAGVRRSTAQMKCSIARAGSAPHAEDQQREQDVDDDDGCDHSDGVSALQDWASGQM